MTPPTGENIEAQVALWFMSKRGQRFPILAVNHFDRGHWNFAAKLVTPYTQPPLHRQTHTHTHTHTN